MKKIDFAKIQVVQLDGTKAPLDMREGIAKLLYQGKTKEEFTLSLKIYASDGPTEISEQEVAILNAVAGCYPYAMASALRESLK